MTATFFLIWSIEHTPTPGYYMPSCTIYNDFILLNHQSLLIQWTHRIPCTWLRSSLFASHSPIFRFRNSLWSFNSAHWKSMWIGIHYRIYTSHPYSGGTVTSTSSSSRAQSAPLSLLGWALFWILVCLELEIVWLLGLFGSSTLLAIFPSCFSGLDIMYFLESWWTHTPCHDFAPLPSLVYLLSCCHVFRHEPLPRKI